MNPVNIADGLPSESGLFNVILRTPDASENSGEPAIVNAYFEWRDRSWSQTDENGNRDGKVITDEVISWQPLATQNSQTLRTI